jgi:endonuclease-3
MPEALAVNEVLTAHYGEPSPNRKHGDALAELIQTILSQNTSDVNSERAYASLMAKFGTFERVADAPIGAIEDAIRPGGLAHVKAPRIKQVLQYLRSERGSVSLDFLAKMDAAAAQVYLTALPGVGPKTAACVLLFALGKDALPVDTHVHRVARRLGLIGPTTGAADAQRALEAQLPAAEFYRFHVNLIRHGRATCKAVRPRCQACPLDAVCPKVGVERGRQPASDVLA